MPDDSDTPFARGMEEQVKALYRRMSDGDGKKLPLPLRAAELLRVANAYSAAAAVLRRHESPVTWLPMMQVLGQSVELTLKACLAGAGIDPPTRGREAHDLVALVDHVTSLGYTAGYLERSMVVHLGHWYHEHLGTGAKFLTRYPAQLNGSTGGAVPDFDKLAGLVKDLCDQAEVRIDEALRAIGRERTSAPASPL